MTFLSLLLYLGVIYVRPGDLQPNWEGLPILDTVAACAIAFTALALGFRRLRWPRTHRMTFMLLFTAAIVLSQLQFLYLAAAKAAFLQFFVNTLLFLLIAINLNTHKRFHAFVTVFMLLTLFLAVDGVRQHFTGMGWGGQMPVRGRIQGIGIFGDPNDLALALVVAVPLLLDRIGEKRLLARLFWTAGLGLSTWAILLTKSRGGFIAFGTTLLVYFAVRKHLVRGIALLAAVAVLFFALNAGRIDETHLEDDSSRGRIEAWSEGLQMFKSNPLLGVGYGAFLDYHELTAHNSFVLSLAELGIVGTLPWLALIYSSLKGLLAARGPGPAARGTPQAWAQSLLASLAGYLVAAFFLSRLYNVVPYVVLGLTTAVIPLATEGQGTPQPSFTMKDAGRVVAVFCSLLIVVYLLIKLIAR